MIPKLIHASFFSGIGGFDIAAEWTGMVNAFHCEIHPFAQRILKHYWPNAKSYADITKTDFALWRGKIDVLSGGFPCQPFSLAGNRSGTDDNRYLWPAMCQAIDTIRPAWVIGENVAGILSMAGKPGNDKEVFFKVDSRNIARLQEVDTYEAIYLRQEAMLLNNICKDLEKIGYSVQPFVVPAAAVGAPHRRDRIWIVAHANEGGRGTRGAVCNGQENNPSVRDNVQQQSERSIKERIVSHTPSDRRERNGKATEVKNGPATGPGQDGKLQSGFKGFCYDRVACYYGYGNHVLGHSNSIIRSIYCMLYLVGHTDSYVSLWFNRCFF